MSGSGSRLTRHAPISITIVGVLSLILGMVIFPQGIALADDSADMQIVSKTPAPNPVLAGNSVTYTIVVKNNAGPNDAQSVTVADALTAADFVSGTVKACVVTTTPAEPCTDPSHFSSYTSGDNLPVPSPVAMNDTRSVKIMGQLSPSFLPSGGHTDDTPSVSSTTTDPNLTNNSTLPLQTTINTQADVSVIQVAKNPNGYTIDATHKINAGEFITYVVTAHNGGPSDAQTVQVKDIFDSDQPTPYLTNPKFYCVITNTEDCTNTAVAPAGPFQTYNTGDPISVGTVSPGVPADRTVVFRTKIPSSVPDGTLIPNTVRAKSTATTDPNLNDNTNMENVIVGSSTVNTLADLSVSQTRTIVGPSSFAPANPGNRHSILWTLTITNAGPSDAQHVEAMDSLDSTVLNLSQAKYCVAPCNPSTDLVSYTNNDILVGTITAGSSAVVYFQAPVQSGLRGGPKPLDNTVHAESTAAGTVAATPDPDPNNNTDTFSDHTGDPQTIYTVPDAPTLKQAEPGSGQIALMWKVPTDGGNTIDGYDILLDNGTPMFVTSGFNSVTCGSDSCLTYVINASNNANHTVVVEARNDAGDSSADPTGGLQAKPCSTCSATLVPATGVTTLNSFNVNNVTTGDCFPQSNDVTRPGATSSPDSLIVSCLKLTDLVAKAGFLTALRERTSADGDCGVNQCLGGQVSLAIPPGAGGSKPAEQAVVFDKTITTALKNGDICNSTPCGSKSTYNVYLNGTLIGTSLMNTWCSASTPAGTSCIISYVHINTSVMPSKVNGNTPNGKQGNGDLILRVRIYADPTLGTCRTCR